MSGQRYVQRQNGAFIDVESVSSSSDFNYGATQIVALNASGYVDPSLIQASSSIVGIVYVPGGTYTTGPADTGILFPFGASGTFLMPNPAPTVSVPSGWYVFVSNVSPSGANATVTINPSGALIDGVSGNIFLTSGQGIRIASDGKNYWTVRGLGTGSGGGGGGGTDVLTRLVSAVPGKPGAGQLCLIYTVESTETYPANFSSPNAYGTCGINPTSTALYSVYKNLTLIGTISISTGGIFTFATTGGVAWIVNPGDRMTIVAPGSQDATLTDVGITLVGQRAPLIGGPAPPVWTWLGAYSGGTAYSPYDVVSYLGSSYICIVATVGNLPTNTSFWSLVAAAGLGSAIYTGSGTPSSGLGQNGDVYVQLSGVAPGGGITIAQVQNETYTYCVDSGAANAYVINPAQTVTALVAGQSFAAKLTNTNTGASMLNVSTLGAVAIKKLSLTGLIDVVAGDLQSGGIYEFSYNGTYWQIVGGGGSVPIGLSQGPDYPPTSPTTYDDEFTDGSLNARWAWVNQGAAVATVAQSFLDLISASPGSGDNLKLLTQAVPATPWEFSTMFYWNGTGTSNFFYAGMAVRDSGTGKLSSIKLDNSSTLSQDDWTNPTTFSANHNSRGWSLFGKLYLKIKDDGTNLIFSYSKGGTGWIVLQSVARTSFLANPNSICIFAGTNIGTGNTMTASFDWFRRTA